jgi:TetR/AcrR family transcriptional regulator
LIKDLFNCEHTGRMSGGERREQILETAVRLFSQNGFNGTTTKEIAAAAGVSEAMVFRHFSSKDALYEAILDTKSCQGESQFPWTTNKVLLDAMARKDDYEVFYNIALHAMNKHQSDQGFMRLLLYFALEEHALASKFFKEFVTRIYKFIGDYIKTRQADGAMRDLEPNIAVRAFMGMLLHHSLNNILWDKKRTVLNISNEEAADNFATILLNGIKK